MHAMLYQCTADILLPRLDIYSQFDLTHDVFAAIAAREREVAERERGAAATAFLESLDLPLPAASPSVPEVGAAASVSGGPRAQGLPGDANLASVLPLPIRAASPASSGASRRSSASMKRAAAEPSRLQHASHADADRELDDDGAHMAAETGRGDAKREHLHAELAVIQVHSF